MLLIRVLTIMSLTFSNSIFALEIKKCNFDALNSGQIEKMSKILKGYTKKNLDIWMSETFHEYDPNIPTTVWVNFDNNQAFIDLLFGIEKSQLMGGHELPWSIPYVDLRYKEEGGKCTVYIRKENFSRSGFIFLHNKSSLNQFIGNINLFRGNNPNLLVFSL